MNNVFARWRELRKTTGRFESAVSRYRHLVEYGIPTAADLSSAMDKAAVPNDDTVDAETKKKIIRRNVQSKVAREDTLKRLRKLALVDFNMVGGVAPIGSMGGSGGSDGSRPQSLGPRM